MSVDTHNGGLDGDGAILLHTLRIVRVVERRHDREQRVDACGVFRDAAGARAIERGQADVDDMRKTVLRFAPRTTDVIAPAHAFAVAVARGRGEAIGKAGDLRGGRADRRLCRTHCRRGHQQPENPDGAAMRIAAAGGLHHRDFSRAADLRQFGAQRRGRRASPRNACERGERRLERFGRADRLREIEVAVRAASAPVDERGLRRELRFVDQRGNRERGELGIGNRSRGHGEIVADRAMNRRSRGAEGSMTGSAHRVTSF